jgi:hypothetical protein
MEWASDPITLTWILIGTVWICGYQIDQHFRHTAKALAEMKEGIANTMTNFEARLKAAEQDEKYPD